MEKCTWDICQLAERLSERLGNCPELDALAPTAVGSSPNIPFINRCLYEVFAPKQAPNLPQILDADATVDDVANIVLVVATELVKATYSLDEPATKARLPIAAAFILNRICIDPQETRLGAMQTFERYDVLARADRLKQEIHNLNGQPDVDFGRLTRLASSLIAEAKAVRIGHSIFTFIPRNSYQLSLYCSGDLVAQRVHRHLKKLSGGGPTSPYWSDGDLREIAAREHELQASHDDRVKRTETLLGQLATVWGAPPDAMVEVRYMTETEVLSDAGDVLAIVSQAEPGVLRILLTRQE